MARKQGAAYKVDYQNGLNLRAAPSKDAEIIKVLPYGTSVEPDPDVETPEGWMAVLGGGYVMKQFLK